MSEENVEVVRGLMDAFNRGDLDAWVRFLSPDVVWESMNFPGLREVYRGRTEAREWIEENLELFEGTHLEIEEITALSDDRILVAAVPTGRGRASGLPIEQRHWSVLSFAEGLITRRRAFWTRAEALEAAGLRD